MEDFVPYKTVLKLEKKGYKGKTIRYHGHIYDVLEWLRKEKKIYVSVEVEREDWFEYKIVQTIKNTRRTGTRVYETYDGAILAGIEYVIDNLI